jgi:hypothetical protein
MATNNLQNKSTNDGAFVYCNAILVYIYLLALSSTPVVVNYIVSQWCAHEGSKTLRTENTDLSENIYRIVVLCINGD